MKKRKVLSIDTNEDRSRMLDIRGQMVLRDSDVAKPYGMSTRAVNQAVRNNLEKFPEGFLFQLNAGEFKCWRSKILAFNFPETVKATISMGLSRISYAFTECGLYMLATILKKNVATCATPEIVETYARLCSKVRNMKVLQTLKDGSSDINSSVAVKKSFYARGLCK